MFAMDLQTQLSSEPTIKDVDIQQQFYRTSPAEVRLSIVKQVTNQLEFYIYSNVSITHIWLNIEDFFSQKSKFPREYREAAYALLKKYVSTQLNLSVVERFIFFKTIEGDSNDNTEIGARLQALSVLTDSGHNITGIENNVCPLLATWLQACHDQLNMSNVKSKPSCQKKYLKLSHSIFCYAANLIKFQFSTIKDEYAQLLVDVIIHICNTTTTQEVILDGLKILDATIRYCFVPKACIPDLVVLLCSTYVGSLSYTKQSKIASENLLRSHFFNVALDTLFRILRDHDTSAISIRGAVCIVRYTSLHESRFDFAVINANSAISILLTSLNFDEFTDLEIVGTVYAFLKNEAITKAFDHYAWNGIFEILIACTRYLPFSSTGTKEKLKSYSTTASLLHLYELILESVELIFSPTMLLQLNVPLFNFYSAIYPVLKTTQISHILSLYTTQHVGHPLNSHWIENLIFLRDHILYNSQNDELSLQAMQIIVDICSYLDENSVIDFKETVFREILEHLVSEERNNIASLIVNVYYYLYVKFKVFHFEDLVNFSKTMINGASTEHVALIGTSLLMKLFYYNYDHQNIDSLKIVFEEIMVIAQSQNLLCSCRLLCFRLLCRIRADVAGVIYINDSSQAKNESHSGEEKEEDNLPNLCYISSSVIDGTKPRIHRWGRPKLKRLVSIESKDEDVALFPSSWLLQIYKNIILHEIDWRVFEYLTLNLSEQLINRSLFENSCYQKWSLACKVCIHALRISCYEFPTSISKLLSAILMHLSRLITNSVLSVHILEFLCSLAQLDKLVSNFTDADYRQVFGVALKYIQHFSSSKNDANAHDTMKKSHSAYVLALAYNVLQIWFLVLRLNERKKYVPFIIRGLKLASENTTIDDLSLVQYDMMQQFCYSNTSIHNYASTPTDDKTESKTWVRGNTLLTIRSICGSGIMDIIVRRPTGTMQYTLYNKTNSRQDMLRSQMYSSQTSLPDDFSFCYPSAVLAYFTNSNGISATSRPLALANDDAVRRAISVFDRIPVIESHKAGLVYVGYEQTNEADILSNNRTSKNFDLFLQKLGNVCELKSKNGIFAGGLDRENDIDGKFAYYWRNRIVQLIYHCTTLMPTNLERDPQCTLKKRHIGNDFVSIIFNESGVDYDFNTIPGQFNFVNIVISPVSKPSGASSANSEFYKVQVLTRQEGSDFSPFIVPKVISADALPLIVRDTTLNAAIFSHIYHEGAGEYVHIWVERLRQIQRLHKRARESLQQTLGKSTSPETTAALEYSLEDIMVDFTTFL
ncbi:tuberin [Schizosaccharomyces japonicus yFS275]|uniref:Tuberin n=1 Tax=Schizosaccharomyces japonicus (strain yFS275 / FY16936) TaxID=402676 RepID=B6K849_SCHJY|nr:tuberin [Schizosaccharomyces japonicus yFS275]EEB09703.2 tuberin [Schizosaccharomyces japonicus yFS275]